MHDPEEIARAFLIESDVDYRVTQLLRGTEFHSRTIAFAQQAVEKLVKACLALRGVVTLDHNLSSLFRALYQADFPEMDEVVRHIAWLLVYHSMHIAKRGHGYFDDELEEKDLDWGERRRLGLLVPGE